MTSCRPPFHRLVPHVAFALFAAGGSFQALSAQTAADRIMLNRWDDSLATVARSADLAPLALLARKNAGPATDVRLALYQLRKAALDDDRASSELALIRLDAVRASNPRWPWPAFAMSREFLLRADTNASMKLSAGMRDGETFAVAGWRQMASALGIDPTFVPARSLAIRVMVQEGDRLFRADESRALQLLARSPKIEPDVYLIDGRDLRRRLQYDSAEAMFDLALHAGSDRGRVQLERARTLRALNDSSSAVLAYWAGVDALTPATREMLRHDLAWVLAPDSVAEFNKVPDDSVAHWLHRFWNERDAIDADAPGTRLNEHLRRWIFVFAHYRVDLPWEHVMFSRADYGFDGMHWCVPNDADLYALVGREQPTHPGDVRHREPLLDNRGVIYMHHGRPMRVAYDYERLYGGDTTDATALDQAAPDDTLRKHQLDSLLQHVGVNDVQAAPSRIPPHGGPTAGPDMRPSESWMYWIDGGWRVLHFRGSKALGTTAPTTLSGYLLPGWKSWLTRANLLPQYYAAAMEQKQVRSEPPSCRDLTKAIIVQSQHDAILAADVDSHTPFIPRPWGAVVHTFGLGSGADHNGETLVTYAIPVDSLTGTRLSRGGMEYQVSARLVAYNRATEAWAELDSTRVVEYHGDLTGKSFLTGSFEMALDPGEWSVAVRLGSRSVSDSAGGYSVAKPVTVPDGRGLSMSDIVTGSANGLDWKAPDDGRFRVDVLGVWPPASSVELYYEVRGLTPGTTYHTLVELRNVDADVKQNVRIDGTDQAGSATAHTRKTLGLGTLAAGTYHLTVTIDDGAHRVTRARDLVIGAARH